MSMLEKCTSLKQFYERLEIKLYLVELENNI